MKKLILNRFKKAVSIMLTAILLLSTIAFEVVAADPKVSIIIPVYNTPENLLRDCLNSAKNQTLKDIEIICVDDGSTDGSGKILDEYAKSDPRFKVIHRENGGPSIARNKGMDLASGEYIQFLDSDDVIDSITSEKSYSIAKQYDADIVRFSMKFVEKGKGDFFQLTAVNKKFEFIDTPNKSVDNVLNYRNVISPVLGVYRNKFLKDNNLRFFDNVKCGEDQYFNILCFAQACKLVFMPDKLYEYRFNNISITTSGVKNKGKSYCPTDVVKDIYRYFENFGYFNNDKAKFEFLNLVLNHGIFESIINNNNLNKLLIDFLLNSELLQDDIIDRLPIAERIRLKSMIWRANPQAKSQKTIDDGIYTISSKLAPNMCLDINQCSKDDKANLQLWQKNGTDAQKFKIQYHAEGYYTIKAMCSGKFIDVSASGKQNGTNIWQYSGSGTDAQKWFIVPDGEGYYSLLPKCNNLCMDVCGAKAKNGANIHCWYIHGDDNQRFKLEKYEGKPSSNKSNRTRKPAGKPRPNKPVKIRKKAYKPSDTKKDAGKPSSSKPIDPKKSA